MFQHWTFSHPGSNPEGRASRYPVSLRVCVTIPFESWQLLWTLRSINVSNTGILAAFDVTSSETAQKALDLDTLLDAQPEVTLQIDADSDDFYVPSLGARLARKSKKQWGLELAFHFTEDNDNLASMIGGLEAGFFANRIH
jgi:hypothetical protein